MNDGACCMMLQTLKSDMCILAEDWTGGSCTDCLSSVGAHALYIDQYKSIEADYSARFCECLAVYFDRDMTT